MGRRGPRPAPTALKVLKGTRPDRVNLREPVPAPQRVIMPRYLSADARAVWKRLAPDLLAKGVLTSWDVDEFAVLCDAVARHRRAAARLDAEGEVVSLVVGETKSGTPIMRVQKSPWQLVWRETAAVVTSVGARFGLSPSDRSQLKMGPPPGGGDSSDRLLS